MESTVPLRAIDTHRMDRQAQPLLHFRGGNVQIPDEIIGHFPCRHRIYVEPFGGSASVLLHKPRSPAEVYNDIDQEVVNLFQVMRDPLKTAHLIWRVRWTPLARDEFHLAAQDADDPIEQARHMLVRSWTAFRCSRANRWAASDELGATKRHWALLPSSWRGVPEALRLIAERLCGVMVENRDPCQVIADYDSPQTLFYVAPPCPLQRRCNRMHKMVRAQAIEAEATALAKALAQIQGHVVLYGNDAELYRDLYPGWRRVCLNQGATAARRPAKVLWLSPGIPPARRHAPCDQDRRP